MRLVADTNIVVSGLLWSGPPQQLINAARAKRITLYSSVILSAEFAEVIAREQFAKRIRSANVTAADALARLARR
ncbi:MAG: putative toxin-antitoxin system toxin component, PIN family [Betaproteobacteria bacterium]|nr:putative toxin-antitoxin system toxin component, PIN family [Betaproteobacteria bacterium]